MNAVVYIIGTILSKCVASVVSEFFIKPRQEIVYIKQENTKNETIDEKRWREEKIARRPEFEIIKIDKNSIRNKDYGLELILEEINGFEKYGDDDIYVYYPNDVLELSKCISYTYELKNVGKSDISEFMIFINQTQSKCLFSKNKLKYYVENGLLNYAVAVKKKIHIGETIKVKIYLNLSHNFGPYGGYEVFLGFKDIYDVFWQQSFFVSLNNISEPKEISKENYFEKIDTSIAVDCFLQRNNCVW